MLKAPEPVLKVRPRKLVPAGKSFCEAKLLVPAKTTASPAAGAMSLAQETGFCQRAAPPSQVTVAAGAVTTESDAAAVRRAARRDGMRRWVMEVLGFG